ncbi:pyrazinamidase/nicotinamidase [Clonorchis sinensis]|uniref:nicotinamidase n=1 Tax=Clonorchis sinensis TaxID=79923 RepID=G7YS95_CLOSI|nr:pyrazinamidase/nicotinamidase [Clonorchis sinensis]
MRFTAGSVNTDRCPARMDAMDIMKPINYLCGLAFKQIYVSKDWHPRDHVSFHENRNRWTLSKNSKIQDAKSAKIYDTITIIDSMGVECNQQLWPTHCVAKSEGAKIHPKLRLPENVIVIEKGTISDVETYSVFGDPNGREDTTLEAKLRASGIKVLVICGIAFDFCVAASVMDASKRGYRVIVLEDACVGIDPAGIANTRRLMLESGVHITCSTKIADILSGNSTPLQHVLKWIHDQSKAQ